MVEGHHGFGTTAHAAVAHILCQGADETASLLKDTGVAQLVSTATTKNIGQYFSTALTHLLAQTFTELTQSSVLGSLKKYDSIKKWVTKRNFGCLNLPHMNYDLFGQQ